MLAVFCLMAAIAAQGSNADEIASLEHHMASASAIRAERIMVLDLVCEEAVAKRCPHRAGMPLLVVSERRHHGAPVCCISHSYAPAYEAPVETSSLSLVGGGCVAQ